MSDSSGAPVTPKGRFDFEFLALWLCVLSGGASAVWAMYQEVMDALRQGKLPTVPYWLFAYICVIIAAWIRGRRLQAERDHLQALLAELLDKRKARESIGKLLADGNELMELINRADDRIGPLPVNEAQAWVDHAAAEIGKLLDSSYVARFHSPAGTGTPGTNSSPKNLLLAATRFRLMRLNEFLAELAPRTA